jgi:hypothetical protein
MAARDTHTPRNGRESVYNGQQRPLIDGDGRLTEGDARMTHRDSW